MDGEEASFRTRSVGARTTTLVHASSPRSPIVPLIPENVAVTTIGPGSLSGLTSIDADAVPLESVRPPQTVILSILTTIVAEITGPPALSIKEREMSKVSPLIVLLSGSRSSGFSIVRTEKPLLSKVANPDAEEKYVT